MEANEEEPRSGVQRAGMILIIVGLVAFGLGVLAFVLVLLFGDDSSNADLSTTTSSTPRVPDEPSATPLRESAGTPRFLVGAAVAVKPLRDDAEYRTTLAREYNAVTVENAMKWDEIHPEQNRYDFAPADSIVDFARENGMTVRGHTLVWYREIPKWVTDRSWTRAELEQVLRDHIRRVVGHYRGKVAEWDVVNEAVDNEGRMRDSIWMRVIGPDYIDLAFRWAREADPDARLYYNDFDLEFPGPKADAAMTLVRGLQDRGVPIDGVGIQGHELTVRRPSRVDLEAALRSYARLGLDVGITELDVGIFVPSSPEELAVQAEVYGDVLDACLAVTRCRTFVTWGFTDAHSWIPFDIPGFDDGLPFDRSYQPKPALDTLRATLASSRG
jgi:endo-1,4-beta-xylanase